MSGRERRNLQALGREAVGGLRAPDEEEMAPSPSK